MRARSFRTITVALASAAFAMSCSKGGGFLGAGGEEDHGSPPPTYDVKTEEISASGCLDLSALYGKLRSLPSDAVMRRYTSDFSIKGPGNTSLRRDFVSIAAFANFAFEEKSADLYRDSFPTVVQTACDSVEFSDPLAGSETFKIEPSTATNTLTITREDGETRTFTLKSPRELEVVTKANTMDPCPNYTVGASTTSQSYLWGTDGEVAQQPIQVSKAYLKKISSGVTQMPGDLESLVIHESADYITVMSQDLRSLTAATLDPEILDCPYKANPPEGDEPPPAPPEATPAPMPTPPPAATPVESAPTPPPAPTPEI